jgi:hypothetical protein
LTNKNKFNRALKHIEASEVLCFFTRVVEFGRLIVFKIVKILKKFIGDFWVEFGKENFKSGISYFRVISRRIIGLS